MLFHLKWANGKYELYVDGEYIGTYPDAVAAAQEIEKMKEKDVLETDHA